MRNLLERLLVLNRNTTAKEIVESPLSNMSKPINLPKEMWTEILLKLPAKEQMKAKRVSKTMQVAFDTIYDEKSNIRYKLECYQLLNQFSASKESRELSKLVNSLRGDKAKTLQLATPSAIIELIDDFNAFNVALRLKERMMAITNYYDCNPKNNDYLKNYPATLFKVMQLITPNLTDNQLIELSNNFTKENDKGMIINVYSIMWNESIIKELIKREGIKEEVKKKIINKYTQNLLDTFQSMYSSSENDLFVPEICFFQQNSSSHLFRIMNIALEVPCLKEEFTNEVSISAWNSNFNDYYPFLASIMLKFCGDEYYKEKLKDIFQFMDRILEKLNSSDNNRLFASALGIFKKIITTLSTKPCYEEFYRIFYPKYEQHIKKYKIECELPKPSSEVKMENLENNQSSDTLDSIRRNKF